MVLTPFDDFLENGFVDLVRSAVWSRVIVEEAYVGNGNGLARVTKILKHVLDQDRALGNSAIYPVSCAPGYSLRGTYRLRAPHCRS